VCSPICHPKTCTFCDIGRIPEENSESTKHLFFECTFVENLLNNFFAWILNERNYEITRREYFIGFNSQNIKKNLILDIVSLVIKKYVWECKTRFCIPNTDNAKDFFLSEFRKFKAYSAKFSVLLRESDLFTHHNQIRF
jgi:hypothetical protein